MKNSINDTNMKYFDGEKFRKRLKELRKEKGMKQKELAEKLGLATERSISNWECGNQIPEFESLRSLCKVLGVSFDYLLGVEDFRHIGNEEIHDITGLSDESIEILREIYHEGDSRYIFMLNLLLSDEKTFSVLMKCMVSLLCPSTFLIDRDRIPKMFLCPSNDSFLQFTPENIKFISDDIPDNVYRRMREIIEEFQKKNKDIKMVTANEYHPIICSEEEVVEYGKH